MNVRARILALPLLLGPALGAALWGAPVMATPSPEAPTVGAPAVEASAAEARPDASAAVAPVAAGEKDGGVDVMIAQRLIEETGALAGRPVNGPLLRRFYAERGFQPLWMAGEGEFPATAEAVLATFRAAEEEGLSAADYPVEAIAARLKAGDRPGRVEGELLLTDAVMAYAIHLRDGRVSPKAVSGDYADVRPIAVDVFQVARDVAAAPDPRARLAALAPRNPFYGPLKGALAKARAAVAGGGWPLVPVARAGRLEIGARDPVARVLRARLIASGDGEGGLKAGAGGDEVFDATLKAALARFQARHGLAADGAPSAATLAALNVTAQERVSQIQANMERARWLPDDFGERHIEVNIPEYTLRAFDHGSVALEMRVIVGTNMRHTPIFSSAITSVILNPTWTMPVKLAREDYLPKAMRDPGYLTSHNISVYAGWSEHSPRIDVNAINWRALGPSGIARLRLRQDPGPGNALGQIKFNIPNDFDVYLHDTPQREKFAQSVRNLSSGCVRVGNPMGLAGFVFAQTPEWPAERRQQQLDTRQTRTVVLKRAVPVHLLYQTLWVDAAGQWQIREDIYGRDGELMEAIGRRGAAGTRLAQAR